MNGAKRLLESLAKRSDGNITILAAVSAPLVIAAAALAVDYGNLTLERRTLQGQADLAAIAAAGDLPNAEQAVLDYLGANGQDLAVRSGEQLLTRNGPVRFSEDTAFRQAKGYADLIKGQYVADPAIAPDKRFVAGATPYDAVRVVLHQQSDLYFASSFTTPPRLSAAGTASLKKLAAFSVGSRLASLDGGLLNSVLGGLLGTQLSLSVMDYKALLDADIDALHLADQMGLDLGITAATYEDVLKTRISYRQFLASLAKTAGLQPNVASILNQLQRSLNKTDIGLTLGQVVNLDPYAGQRTGSENGLVAGASVFDLVTAAASAANAGKQVALDLGATVPGLASTRLILAIGEPPAGTPMLALGRPGSIVRTAQTRIGIVTTVDGLSAIAGLKVRLPLYVQVAYAEAKLANIRCLGGATANGSVDVAVVPGVAEIALGDLDDKAFDNFGAAPRVSQAAIIDSKLLKVLALAHADATNLAPKTLTFPPSDISAGVVKSVSTAQTLTSLTTSLLDNLDLDVNVLGGLLTLGTPTAIDKALAQTLSAATAPVDQVLYNTLLLLGVKIGEADVRVTGVRCQRPVLVN